MGKYRILSFDGGGMKGALSVKALQMLSDEVPDLLKNVNLIAGTSTGGLITLGLGAGKSPKELVDLYATQGAAIFDPYKIFGNNEEIPFFTALPELAKNSLGNMPNFNLQDIIFPKYNNQKFKDMLDGLFKDTPKFGALRKNVLVTTFQINNHSGWTPLVISNLKDSPYLDASCADAALRTSAAPTYFPLYNGCADGGIYANNPSMIAVSTALDKAKVGVGLDEIYMLSFGTGSMVTYKDAGEGSTPWGILQWLNPYGTSGNDPQAPLLGAMMDGVSMITDYQCTHILGAAQYHRLNIPLDKPYAMDDWKDVNYLFECAENYPKKNPREWENLVNWVKEFFI